MATFTTNAKNTGQSRDRTGEHRCPLGLRVPDGRRFLERKNMNHPVQHFQLSARRQFLRQMAAADRLKFMVDHTKGEKQNIYKRKLREAYRECSASSDMVKAINEKIRAMAVRGDFRGVETRTTC